MKADVPRFRQSIRRGNSMFNAILIERDPYRAEFCVLGPGAVAGRRGDRPRRLFHPQLQGCACHHRQGAGGASVSHGAWNRFRRSRRDLQQRRLQARRQSCLERLGGRRNSLGRLAQLARVKGDWLIPLPPLFTARQAMAIGTAGYTAMLCVLALERHGLHCRPAVRSS